MSELMRLLFERALERHAPNSYTLQAMREMRAEERASALENIRSQGLAHIRLYRAPEMISEDVYLLGLYEDLQYPVPDMWDQLFVFTYSSEQEGDLDGVLYDLREVHRIESEGFSYIDARYRSGVAQSGWEEWQNRRKIWRDVYAAPRRQLRADFPRFRELERMI